MEKQGKQPLPLSENLFLQAMIHGIAEYKKDYPHLFKELFSVPQENISEEDAESKKQSQKKNK